MPIITEVRPQPRTQLDQLAKALCIKYKWESETESTQAMTFSGARFTTTSLLPVVFVLRGLA